MCYIIHQGYVKINIFSDKLKINSCIERDICVKYINLMIC